MSADTAVAVFVPLVVLAILWTVVRHWILPFVLGFALAVALGPSARPLLAGAWELVANAGDAIFGSREPEYDPRGWEPERRPPPRYE
jgi:hypothetical protein